MPTAARVTLAPGVGRTPIRSQPLPARSLRPVALVAAARSPTRHWLAPCHGRHGMPRTAWPQLDTGRSSPTWPRQHAQWIRVGKLPDRCGPGLRAGWSRWWRSPALPWAQTGPPAPPMRRRAGGLMHAPRRRGRLRPTSAASSGGPESPPASGSGQPQSSSAGAGVVQPS